MRSDNFEGLPEEAKASKQIDSLVQFIDTRLQNTAPSHVMLAPEDWTLLRAFVLVGAGMGDSDTVATWLEGMHDFAEPKDQPRLERAAAAMRGEDETPAPLSVLRAAVDVDECITKFGISAETWTAHRRLHEALEQTRAAPNNECGHCGEPLSKHVGDKQMCPDAAVPDIYRFAPFKRHSSEKTSCEGQP